MRQDFLDQLERQLVDATERGAKRRRFWHRRLRLRVPTVAGVAVAVTAVTATALAAGLGVLPAGHAKHRVKPPALAVRSLTSAGAVPARFSPDSFTAISEFTWWLLGTSPCDGSSSCTTMVRTQDGGRSFTRIAAPPVQSGYEVRFADPQDGYVFGSRLWTTHDGGVSWQRVKLGGSVVEVAASGPYVYAIVWRDGASGRLMRSPVGRDHWTTLRGAGYAYTGLWVQGSDVLLDSGGRPGLGGQLRISYDDGARFVTYDPPSAGACQFQEAPPDVIWSQCGRVPGGEAGEGIWRSTDAGAVFRTAAGEGIDNPDAVFSGASSTVAVVGYQQLYRTTDGGLTYSEVPTPQGVRWWDYLGFTDSTHGVALGSFRGGNRLYYTVDGGASYHYVPIDPT